MRFARATRAPGFENYAQVADVLVVGGGLSGLVCARAITAAGASALVLEARDRLGGRVRSVPLGGATVDVGGCWIAPGQPRITALAADLGIATEPQVRAGRAMLVRGPDRDLLSRVPLAAAVDLTLRSRALDRLEARATADTSVADWLRARVRTGRARDLLATTTLLKLGCEPEEVSARSLAAHLAGSGGLLGGVDPDRDQVEHRVAGGAGRLIEALGALLGDAVWLSAPVSALQIDGDGVTAIGPGLEARGRQAVLALAPALAARLEAPLPLACREAAAASVAGAVLKVIVGYERPFWRDAQLSGESVNVLGPVTATADVSTAAQPALAALCIGAAARTLASRSPADRIAEVTAALEQMFGAAAAGPACWVEGNWPADPYSPGCVVAAAPGRWQPLDRLARPGGPLHLAGTETAARWAGYMEGAVVAGERAAAAALAAL